jgi:hypothetical protein
VAIVAARAWLDNPCEHNAKRAADAGHRVLQLTARTPIQLAALSAVVGTAFVPTNPVLQAGAAWEYAREAMPHLDWDLVAYRWIIRDLTNLDPAQDRFDAAVAALAADNLDAAVSILAGGQP